MFVRLARDFYTVIAIKVMSLYYNTLANDVSQQRRVRSEIDSVVVCIKNTFLAFHFIFSTRHEREEGKIGKTNYSYSPLPRRSFYSFYRVYTCDREQYSTNYIITSYQNTYKWGKKIIYDRRACRQRR